jgi:hypothetical protein
MNADTRLSRARKQYNDRVLAAYNQADDPSLVAIHSSNDGDGRKVVSGTDLDYDEFCDAADMVAQQVLKVMMMAGGDPIEAIAGVWRAGVLVGILHERDGRG